MLTLLATHTNLPELWATVRTASVPWLAAGLAIYTGIIAVSTWRWRLLLSAQHTRVPARRLFSLSGAATYALRQPAVALPQQVTS